MLDALMTPMPRPMTMFEAANRLRVLAEAHVRGGVTETPSGGYDVSELELEAVTVAAAILGMFVEALEDSGR